MPRRQQALIFVLTSLCAVPAYPNASAAPARRPGVISERRDVPSDPLAGIPEEDTQAGRGQRGRKDGGLAKNTGEARACRLEIKPESEEKVGDLRAALAVIQHGLRTTPCPAALPPSPLRIQLTIDGSGKIDKVQTLAGDPKLASALTQRLSGWIVESKITTATQGVAQVSLLRK